MNSPSVLPSSNPCTIRFDLAGGEPFRFVSLTLNRGSSLSRTFTGFPVGGGTVTHTHTLRYQAKVGAGARELFLAEERGLAHLFTLPGVREWWEANPYAFTTEFRSYIETFRPGPPADQG